MSGCVKERKSFLLFSFAILMITQQTSVIKSPTANRQPPSCPVIPANWNLSYYTAHSCQERALVVRPQCSPTFNPALMRKLCWGTGLFFTSVDKCIVAEFPCRKRPPHHTHTPTPTKMMDSWWCGRSPGVKQIEYAHRNKAGGFTGLW